MHAQGHIANHNKRPTPPIELGIKVQDKDKRLRTWGWGVHEMGSLMSQILFYNCRRCLNRQGLLTVSFHLPIVTPRLLMVPWIRLQSHLLMQPVPFGIARSVATKPVA